MTSRNLIRSAAFAALAAAVLSGPAAAAERNAPFGYPTTALDAPATYAEPPAAFVQIGRARHYLGEASFEDLTAALGAERVREGEDMFEREFACVAGTENGRPVVLWLISSDLKTLTEAQLEVTDAVPGRCARVAAEALPFRLGRLGMGMTRAEALEYVGEPSGEDGFGWSYWFGQRFLKNARGLQELELDWLGAEFRDGRAVRAFASLVKNP